MIIIDGMPASEPNENKTPNAHKMIFLCCIIFVFEQIIRHFFVFTLWIILLRFVPLSHFCRTFVALASDTINRTQEPTRAAHRG